MISNELLDLYSEEYMDGEEYVWPNQNLYRLKCYAFQKGFAVVTLSGSLQKGRMRFGCIPHGKLRDTRKVDAPELGIGTYLDLYSHIEYKY